VRLLLLQSDPSTIPSDFWTSSDCELLILARWARERADEVKFLQQNLPSLSGHVWLSTSGTLSTAGQSNWIAISKVALLASAAAVNQHLAVTASDRWGLVLPLAHVGGLGILARAHLAGQSVHVFSQEKWHPENIKECEWLSLVPTQVHDIVQAEIHAPKALKGVIVGGDRLADDIYAKGLRLGWPLLRSYGLTECSSQVATALPGSVGGQLHLLPHVTASTDDEGVLSIDSPALFTAKAQILDGVVTFKTREAGPWKTQDRVQLRAGRTLEHLGRIDQTIKIRGEKVDLVEMEKLLQRQLGFQVILLAFPDPRDGLSLVALSERDLSLEELNRNLLPHQKIKHYHQVQQFPRTELGKIKRGELQQLLGKTSW